MVGAATTDARRLATGTFEGCVLLVEWVGDFVCFSYTHTHPQTNASAETFNMLLTLCLNALSMAGLLQVCR